MVPFQVDLIISLKMEKSNKKNWVKKWKLRFIILVISILIIYLFVLDEDREMLNMIRRFVKELLRAI